MRLEARLAVLHQVDALLVARRRRSAASPGFLSRSRTTSAWMGTTSACGAEAGEDVGLHGEPGLDVRRRVLDLHLHPELDRVLAGAARPAGWGCRPTSVTTPLNVWFG